MSTGSKIVWAVAGIGALLIWSIIVTPNLLRSRVASRQAVILGKLQRASESDADAGKTANNFAFNQVTSPTKKLIHNAELALTVGDVRKAADQIVRLTEQSGGEVGKLEMTDNGSGVTTATLLVRVPATGFDGAIAAFKKVAIRTEREQLISRDVTREFYDNEAHMRNLQAEEQQYLAIMRRAGTIKDTLEASKELSDVRDRIERLQTQIQIMTHDIEMSQVAIALSQEANTQVLGFEWKPLNNTKSAVRDLLSGIGDWLDWVITVLIKLPLILLWVGTVGFIVWVLWRVGRRSWLRWFHPARNLKNEEGKT